nr:immunoglobulin light chain junction region [Macaca mulatta]MOV76868.1 immunoglobulin light chain junction region [Macaca mulatta]MOV77590.1 immunoglobulin light chain junction region [Macaca mulatta]MOV78748.1 immunoglobulin light chain junction region [Macaca mulatta]MOV84868.1 immunoglobulin light chain junction region [Macaca mulatta]
CQQHNVYPPTF